MYNGNKYEIELNSDGTWRKKEDNNGGCLGFIIIFIIVCGIWGSSHKTPNNKSVPTQKPPEYVQNIPKDVNNSQVQTTIKQTNTQPATRNTKYTSDIFNKPESGFLDKEYEQLQQQQRYLQRQQEKELKNQQKIEKQLKKEQKKQEKEQIKEEKRLLKQSKKEAKTQKNILAPIPEIRTEDVEINQTE